MIKADPDCEQCGGRGWDGVRRESGVDIEWCDCIKEDYDLSPGAINLHHIPFIPDPDPVSYHVGTWKEPIKPKRKRHILKRKSRLVLYTARDRALVRILRYLCI